MIDAIKNQPIDKRTLVPFAVRIILATVALAVGILLTPTLMPKLMKLAKLSKYADLSVPASYITWCIMYLRYVRATCNRKWGYAYLLYVYDCMQRPESTNCPRCKSMLDKEFTEPAVSGDTGDVTVAVKSCSCPNKNCGLTIDRKLKYHNVPASRYGVKALVMNMGIKDDFTDSIFELAYRFVIALIGSAAFSAGIILLIEKIL